MIDSSFKSVEKFVVVTKMPAVWVEKYYDFKKNLHDAWGKIQA